jgi:hypothetical protein
MGRQFALKLFSPFSLIPIIAAAQSSAPRKDIPTIAKTVVVGSAKTTSEGRWSEIFAGLSKARLCRSVNLCGGKSPQGLPCRRGFCPSV